MKIEKVNCFSCGKEVTIFIPFVGCVYCEECMSTIDVYTASAKEFMPRRKALEWVPKDEGSEDGG